MGPDEFIRALKSRYPWIEQIGLDAKWFQEAAAQDSGNGDTVLSLLRGTPQYQQRFPGRYRQDGSVRMTEAEYLARESDYRRLLQQYGYDMSQYETPTSLVGFFESDQDPNELQTRLETYRNIERSSQAQRDAFYVYAGLDVSTDDLYEAVVDPAAAQRLTDEYNRAIASQSFDYETWITRATEVGLRRVADALSVSQGRGEITAAAVQGVLQVDPSFARQIMDAIYTGGTGQNPTSSLSLEELVSAFEYAAIGASASGAGLELPSRERIAEIRAAGVDQARAREAYMSYGRNANAWASAVERAGGGEFDQDTFEQVAFLGNADAAGELERALSQEEAAGARTGSFRFAEDDGRLVQRGLKV